MPNAQSYSVEQLFYDYLLAFAVLILGSKLYTSLGLKGNAHW